MGFFLASGSRSFPACADCVSCQRPSEKLLFLYPFIIFGVYFIIIFIFYVIAFILFLV